MMLNTVDISENKLKNAFNNFCQTFQPKHTALGEKKLIVFYGPPCSGKTTISKILAEKYNLHRITLDLIRAKYFTKDVLFTDDNNKDVFELFIQIIESLICKNQSVICEGLFISNERKQKVINIQEEACFIYFTASLNTLTNRLNKRYILGSNSEGLFEETLTKEQLEQFYQTSNPPLNNGLIADTEYSTIDNTVAFVERIICSHFQTG